MAPFLGVEGLKVSFGETSVLDELSFQIEEGEVYCLLGPNGAGKSTTINVICDILRPLAGGVTIGGASNTDVPREALGIVPQETAVYRDLTCIQNLTFFGAVYGLNPTARRERAETCLEAVGLSERADSIVSELSGGMRRRLHLASALLHEPPLLILDEPTVGLDLEIRQRIWNLISDLKRDGRSILLTTHHLEEAERIGTRVGIMDEGRIAAEGTMDELRQLVPAEELAVVETEDPEAVCKRARELGLRYRRNHGVMDLYLTQKTDIRSVVHSLGDIPLTSVRLKPVGLEEVFAEVVGGSIEGLIQDPESAST
ncbi:MAG: ABC transporter ATP-binding protein [Gemmatimonadetes bacterium]|nr:ABC transporter ATP-binding protein [Gemmatimonadota bacterium]NNM04602.1 ABC transporter ATP-binding protein [Gemmatimonadota bacterium]